MLKRWFLILIILALSTRVFADASPLVATAYQPVSLLEGPGVTYLQKGRLNVNVPVTIVERNNIGNWVHVQRKGDSGNVITEGWVLSGLLNLSPDLKFSEVPINTTLADAVPENGQFALRDLYALPVLPTISDQMKQLYIHGRDDLRNYSYVITKVGDSLSADPLYLRPMSQPMVALGPYDYLADTITYFGASTSVDSVAAHVGMNTYTVLDPTWADKSLCQPNESPLDCEYRRKRPSIALIMYGPNDVLHISDAEYDVQMRAIVDDTIKHGIIPVLSTFSYDPNSRLWNQAVQFNLRLIKIADDYHVPLINLWLAARALPSYGLDTDHTHMKHWGLDNLSFADGYVAFSGAALRNLLSICTLDEIRRTVILDPNAAG